MKKPFFLFFIVVSAVASGVDDIPTIKKLFESKIKSWHNDQEKRVVELIDHDVEASSASYFVSLPESMKPDFQYFFTKVSDENKNVLKIIAGAIKRGEMVSLTLHAYKVQRTWPIPVRSIASLHIEHDWLQDSIQNIGIYLREEKN